MDQVRPDDNPEYQEGGRSDGYSRGPQDLPPGENPGSRQAAGSTDTGVQEPQYHSTRFSDAYLIQRAHEIYTASSDYLDANITHKWETNLAHFNNEHAPASRFRTKNFKRSAIFRPKTRTMTKSQESAVATALFSTEKVAVIRAENPKDPAQVLSAKIVGSILQYRLSKRMRWFQTVIGAFQSTNLYGVVISHQYWRYEIDTDVVPAFDDTGGLKTDEHGTPMGIEQPRVRHDTLCCDLVAPENFRFDPMCDWRDPANTSPYLVYLMPIYAGDALEKMAARDPKTGQPVWIKHPLGAILGTRRQDYDRTRQAREGHERIDPADEQHGNAFTIVWAHLNIIKDNGEDWVYWTMGTELLLTQPQRLRDLHPELAEGERPFIVGFSTVEAFRNYPAGDVEQIAGLQEETNLVVNQRLDNVKLVLNKRYYVRRGAQVDLEALMRNVAGGGVMMNDPDADVKTVDTNDVTSSSYIEQDRLSNEIDDLVGSFSPAAQAAQSSQQTSPGSLTHMASSAGAVQDYGIKVFNETWVEPALRQMVKLIQRYETDPVILTHAAEDAQLWQRYGTDEITDELLRQDLTVNVDVGMGNTDPVRRVERLIYGINQAIQIPGMADRIRGPEITDEIFAALGYRDSGRFFLTDEEYEELTAAQPPQDPPEIALKKQELEIRAQDNALRDARERDKFAIDAEIRMRDIASREGMSMEQLYTQLKIEDDRNRTMRDTTAVNANNKIVELKLKQETGEGI